MKILKRENWWIWLIITIFSQGSGTFVLGALLDVYDKKAWYAKPKYWIIGALLFIFPLTIMVSVFSIQILCQTAAKLDVKYKEIYLSPYIWIIGLIIPIIGWIFLAVMTLYLEIDILVNLCKGYGEKYIN